MIMGMGGLLAACSGPAVKEAPPPAGPEPRLEQREQCELLGTSQGCAAGHVCCWLPPTLSEQPRCLPSCKGKGEGFCGEVLGGAAQCIEEDGCCMWPKVMFKPASAVQPNREEDS